MRKTLLTFCFTMIACTTLVFGQAQRYALFEHFTNTGCGPCAVQNPAFEAFYAENNTSCHHISYHPSFPSSSDPFYLDNTSENTDRLYYYEVGGVPTMIASGTDIGGPGSVTESTVTSIAAGGSPVAIDVDVEGTDVTVSVSAFGAVPEADWKLRVAVVEGYIEFASAPGSNGETHFLNVFREFTTGSAGEDFNAPEVGSSNEYTYSFTMGADWDPAEIYAVAFIQRDDTQEVLNSGSSRDWKVSFSPTTPTFQAGEPGMALDFDGTMSFGDASTLVAVDVEVSAPSDWTASVTTPLGSLPLASFPTTIDFTAGDGSPLGMSITPNSYGLGQYTIILSNPDFPDISKRYTFTVNNGVTDLIVGTDPAFYETYTTALTEVNSRVGVVDAALFPSYYAAGTLEDVMNIYYVVSWSNGFPAFTDTQVGVLADFCDKGGNLLMTGQDIGWDTWDTASGLANGTPTTQAFYTDYLQSEYLDDGNNDSGSVGPNFGVDDYGTGDLPVGFIYPVYGSGTSGAYIYPDVIQPTTDDGEVICLYNNDDELPGAVRADNGTFKMVYIGIGLEMTDASFATPFLQITHDWFYDGVSTEDYDALIGQLNLQAAPNPANAYTVVSFEANEAATQLQLMDISGRTIMTNRVDAGTSQVTLTTSGLAAGTYFYQLLDAQGKVIATDKLAVTH